MQQPESSRQFYRTLRRADLRKMDELLDAVCVEWDQLADGYETMPTSQLASVQWAQSMQRAVESLRAAQASLAAMHQLRASRPDLH